MAENSFRLQFISSIGTSLIIIYCLSWGMTTPLWGQHIRPFPDTTTLKPAYFTPATSPNSQRKKWVSGVAGIGYVGAGLYLGTVWYAQEDLSSFHFFDDSHEWKQMDKAGHAWGTYTASRWMIGLYKWAGLPKKKAILLGTGAGFLAMSTVEVFDGFGETWGFSWPDVGANFLGAALAATNQWLWHENRLQLKVSYLKSPYAGDPRYEDVFGRNFAEWLLKDYNGHTIWLSARVHSFLPPGKFKELYPRWLNLAVGYGGENMIGGYQDPAVDWRSWEYRQWYLSFDVDFANLRTRSGWLKNGIEIVTMFRLPLPSLRWDRNGFAVLPFQ